MSSDISWYFLALSLQYKESSLFLTREKVKIICFLLHIFCGMKLPCEEVVGEDFL